MTILYLFAGTPFANLKMSYFVIVVIFLVYFALYFTDTLLKSCLHLPYLTFLETSGISIRPLQLKWSTRSLNRLFQRWGGGGGWLARLWFTAGVWVTCALLVPSLLLLVYTVYTLLAPAVNAEGKAAPAPAFVLEPVLPGVNLPTQDVPYYVITLLICSVYHECGHAVAAVREQVRVYGSGLLLVLVLPAAFVDLCSETLMALSPRRRLRVLCAGVWHNVVLCAAAAALLAAMPLLTAPFYHVNQGIVVYDVYQDSPLHGATGLSAGDLVTAVDECAVLTRRDWLSCLARAATEPQSGYCVTTNFTATYDETIHHPYVRDDTGLVECCDAGSGSNLCFEFAGDEASADWTAPPFSCLPARAVLGSRPARCRSTASCGEQARCYLPLLEPHARLMALHRRHGQPVLFVGAPVTVFRDAAASDHVPRWWPLPAAAPRRLETLAHYLLSFSAALAVLNAVPCYALDGQWIWAALLEAAVGGRLSRRKRARLEVAGTLAGSALLAANVLLGLRGLFAAP